MAIDYSAIDWKNRPSKESPINAANLNKIDTELGNSITEVNRLTTAEGLLETRVDNLAHLTDGSTTGDAELIDTRIGADGTVYSNSGNAVRGQVTDLNRNVNNLSNVVAETIPEAALENVVPLPGYTIQDRQNTIFTLNDNYSKVLGVSIAASGKESIVCPVTPGRKYKLTYFETTSLRYTPGYAFVDDDLNVLAHNTEAAQNHAATADVVAPVGSTKVFVMHSSANYDPKCELYVDVFTSKSYYKNETYTKTEVDNLMIAHKTRILVNFDAPATCYTDGRHELCMKYKIPYTVNVTINANGTVSYPGKNTGNNYIQAMMEDGVDFSVYSALYPVDEPEASEMLSDDTYLDDWITYATLSKQAAETVGIFNPTAFFCRYMRTGTTLNKALIKTGFRICRGAKYPSEVTTRYFDLNTFSNVDPDYFNVTAKGCNVTSNSGHPYYLLDYIDYAVEHGLDIAPFAHGIFATEEEAEEYDGTTREILETVLAHIRELVDEGKAEVCTFRDYYKLKYFCDGTMNDIARDKKYNNFMYGT